MKFNTISFGKAGSSLFQKALAGLSTVFLIPITLFGQSDTSRIRELEQVVISGSRIEENLMDVPRSISVIDREKIQKSNYLHVGELLAREAGIYIIGTGQTPGSNQSLFMRGANSNQTLVLIDGVRINDPSSPNAAIELSELSVADIERIEIVRGSHSTMYGTSGVGGVINLITKKSKKPGSEANLRLNTGTFGKETSLFRQELWLGHQLSNGWFAQGSIDHQQVRGLDASKDTLSNPTIFRTQDRDDFFKLDYSLKAGKQGDKGYWNVLYRGVNQEADIDAGAYRDDDNNRLEFSRNLFQYQWDQQWGNRWNTKVLAAHTQMSRQNVNDSSLINSQGNTNRTFFESNYSGKFSTAEFQAVRASANFRLSLGAGFQRDEMAFDTYYYSNSQWGVFEQRVNYDSVALISRQVYAFMQGKLSGNAFSSNLSQLQLTGGLRINKNNFSGTNLSFDFSPSWNFTDESILYLSMASGFNNPSLYQLYDPSKGFNSFTSRGNANLKPENSRSLELGFKTGMASNYFLELSTFENRVENAIEYVYLWRRGQSTQNLSFADYRGDTYINIASQKVMGVELGIKRVFEKGGFLSGNLSYLNGQFEFDPTNLDSEILAGHFVQLYNNGLFLENTGTDENLVRRPNFMLNLQGAYPFAQKWEAGFYLRHVGSRPDIFYEGSLGPFGALATRSVDAYGTTDLNLAFQPHKKLRFMARAENVLNADYAEINGFNTRGRAFFIQINASLN
jgi:vitamin B12 transporter